MRDDGLFCRKSEYGRGGGYPWQFGDPLNDGEQLRRCERDNGSGQCEKNGLIWYPKCKPGFYSFGCCLCRPTYPDCAGLGLGGQFDLSCAKRVLVGKVSSPNCPPGKEYNAGLCYNSCGNKYFGVGPICWSAPPTGWVDCGMGAAIDS